jgi:hypothetical protein
VTNVKRNEYYTKIHDELSKKYGVDKLTAAQMGGLRVVNVTINQIIKILIFIYNVIKQKNTGKVLKN